MRILSCDAVRDELPAWERGELSDEAAEAVRVHVARCAECAAEAETLRLLLRHRSDVSDVLQARVRRAATVTPRRRRLMVYGGPAALAASIIGVLFLGRAVLQGDDSARKIVPDSPPAAAAAVGVLAPEVVPGQDGVLAGGLVLESLSDHELRTLLQEMGS